MMWGLFFLLEERFGIVLLSKDLQNLFSRFGKLSETLSVTCSAQLVLTPIMMYYFNTISIFSVFTNLIVAPITGIITIFGFVIFIVSKIYFPLARLLTNFLYVLAKFTIVVANSFAKISFSSIKVITPNFLEILFFYFIVFYLSRKDKSKISKKEK